MNNARVQISGGPDRFDLAASLFAVSDGIALPFMTKEGATFRCYIYSVSREDGTGQSFNITGGLRNPQSGTIKRVSLYYCTSSKTGTLQFE